VLNSKIRESKTSPNKKRFIRWFNLFFTQYIKWS